MTKTQNEFGYNANLQKLKPNDKTKVKCQKLEPSDNKMKPSDHKLKPSNTKHESKVTKIKAK